VDGVGGACQERGGGGRDTARSGTHVSWAARSLQTATCSRDNARAVALYARNGYALRRTIPFWSLQRA